MEIDVVIHDGYFPVETSIDNSVEGFHKAIECETFEGYSSTELGLLYGLDIYLDGNGKFDHNKPVTGLFVRDGKVVDFIVGKVLICRHDEEGDSTSVAPGDIALLPQHLQPKSCFVTGDGFPYPVADCLLVLYC